jgi:pyruvate,orthophosphate dikinase
MRYAIREGRTVKPDLKIGICGEHGGDPVTIDFCYRAGLSYVSCSPFRVPLARLAAAQAVINNPKAGAEERGAGTVAAKAGKKKAEPLGDSAKKRPAKKPALTKASDKKAAAKPSAKKPAGRPVADKKAAAKAAAKRPVGRPPADKKAAVKPSAKRSVGRPPANKAAAAKPVAKRSVGRPPADKKAAVKPTAKRPVGRPPADKKAAAKPAVKKAAGKKAPKKI